MDHKKPRRLMVQVLILAGLFTFLGCDAAYYAAMEKIGKEKRHLLADKVEDVKESQTEAQEEFKDALTQIKELYGFDGGDLEKVYERVKSSYEDCDSRADQIRKRIIRVKEIAGDMFVEWETEIGQIQAAKQKASSRESRDETLVRYKKLEKAMDKSAAAMEPVLLKLRDNVLFLKHNLNARAVGVLGQEALSIETDVTALIKDMNAAIAEADKFITDF